MNSVCLKSNLLKEQAEEIMDFLYCDKFDTVQYENNDTIIPMWVKWFSNGKMIAKWTYEYKNLMIDKSLIKH